jgi:hypothetical protein
MAKREVRALPLPREYLEICEKIERQREEAKRKQSMAALTIAVWPRLPYEQNEFFASDPDKCDLVLPPHATSIYATYRDKTSGSAYYGKFDIRDVTKELMRAPTFPYMHRMSTETDVDLVLQFILTNMSRHIVIKKAFLDAKDDDSIPTPPPSPNYLGGDSGEETWDP